MKQNKEIFEKYADKLLTAMKAEKLMNKEVAEIFGVPAYYMTDTRKHPERIVMPFMEKIRTWAISGKPLRGYKLPDGPDLEAAEINQQEADRERAEMKFRSKLALKGLLREHSEEMAAAVGESVSTEEAMNEPDPSPESKETIALHFRKEYEQAKRDLEGLAERLSKPQDEIKIVAHKNGKVDVSKLDPRTGALAAAELFFDESGAFHLTYKFKP